MFNKPNIQNLKSYMESSKSERPAIQWYSLPLGTTVLRVLPPWDATGQVALPVWSHRIEYSDPGSNYKKYSWVCLHRTFDKECPICSGLEKLRLAGIPVEEYEPNSRTFYINALIMSDPNYGRTAEAVAPMTRVLMRIPKTVYDWIVNQITNPAVGDITDPVNGLDIFVTKSGTGLNTQYSCTFSPNGRSPIDPSILSSLDLYNISDIFSTGFSEDQIGSLINSLSRASVTLPNQMGQVQQSMYPQYYQQPVPQYQQPVPQYQQPVQQYQQPVQPSVAQAYRPEVIQNQGAYTPAAPNTQQMAGTTPQVLPPSASIVPPVAQATNPTAYSYPQGNNTQVPPPAYGQTSFIPTNPVQAQQSTPPATNSQYPKCFKVGYDSAQVTCITCPYEADCATK